MVRAGEAGVGLNDNDQRLLETIAGLKAAYPRADFNQASVSIYFRALSDLPLHEVEDAVVDLIRTSQYPPTIAEIRERAAELRLGLPSPAEAWLRCQSAEGRHDLPDAVKLALKAVGGSWAIRATDNIVVLRSQFLRAYNDFRGDAIRAVTSARPQRKEITESGEPSLGQRRDAPAELQTDGGGADR